MPPSISRLQRYAIWISLLSIVYNGFEGGISIGFGAESSSRSLVIFGVQSGIEVASAAIVFWRFLKVAKPGEEKDAGLSDRELRFEKYSTLSIGVLLLVLSLATEISAGVSLGLRQEPDSSTSSLVISASALVLMILIWIPKRYLARALNSSAMQGEATCSLSCIQITCVLFVGSLVFRVWKGGWWVDGATSIVLGLLFGWEGFKMVRWATNPKFDGGCCDTCRDHPVAEELGEQYRDICECCAEKEACKNADTCQCATCDPKAETPVAGGTVSQACCAPRDDNKCCTREMRPGSRPIEQPRAASPCCSNSPCSNSPCCDQPSPPACTSTDPDCCRVSGA